MKVSNPKNYTMKITEDMVCAKSEPRISTKSACILCKKINRRHFSKAKKFMEDLLNEKISIDGKYYSKASREILKLLKSLELNAQYRDIDPALMKLSISAHQGPKMLRSRRKRNFGMKLKMTNLQAVLIPIKKRPPKRASPKEKEKPKEAGKKQKPKKEQKKPEGKKVPEKTAPKKQEMKGEEKREEKRGE